MTDEDYIRYGLELPEDTLLILIPGTDEVCNFRGELTEELKEWCAINTPSAQFTVRHGRDFNIRYGCFVFATEKELIAFKLRWFDGT